MSDLDPRGPAEFEPVRIGPRRRRVDPVAFGIVLIVVALGVARGDLRRAKLYITPNASIN